MNLPANPIEWALVEIPGDPAVGIAHASFEIELYADLSCLSPEDGPGHLSDLRKAIADVYVLMSGEPAIVTFDFELEAREAYESRRGLKEAAGL